MVTVTLTGAKYADLHDSLITAGHAPESVFIDGDIYTVNFIDQETADAAQPVIDGIDSITSEPVTPPVDQDTADMWEAILALSAKLDALEGK
jgi:hypothetical protein